MLAVVFLNSRSTRFFSLYQAIRGHQLWFLKLFATVLVMVPLSKSLSTMVQYRLYHGSNHAKTSLSYELLQHVEYKTWNSACSSRLLTTDSF